MLIAECRQPRIQSLVLTGCFCLVCAHPELLVPDLPDNVSGEDEDAFKSLLRSAFTSRYSEFSGYRPQLAMTKPCGSNISQAPGISFSPRRASADLKFGTTYLTLGGRVLRR